MGHGLGCAGHKLLENWMLGFPCVSPGTSWWTDLLIYFTKHYTDCYYRLLRWKQQQLGEFQEESESPHTKINPFPQGFLSVTIFWCILSSSPKCATCFKYCGTLQFIRPFEKNGEHLKLWCVLMKQVIFLVFGMFTFWSIKDWWLIQIIQIQKWGNEHSFQDAGHQTYQSPACCVLVTVTEL